MKILLSAYSCAPNSGSEKQVGWDWVKALSKTKNVIHVITRTKNKAKITKVLKNHKLSNINFLYYDLPSLFIKLFKRRSSYVYFLLWQIGICLKFKKFIINSKFNYIHHVSLVSYRIPSFLGLFSKKFIFGPVSGGEMVPTNLLNKFHTKHKIIEMIRLISNHYIRFSLLMNLTFIYSYKIYVTTKESKKFIPKKYHYKTFILPAVFSSKTNFRINNLRNKKYNIFFAGRLIEWKGVKLLKDIFLNINKLDNKIKLNIYGDGYLNHNLKKFIQKNQFQKKILITNYLSQKKFLKRIGLNDILIFPTFRDSGGYVIIETLLNGKNVITTNAAGPRTMIKSSSIKLIDIHKNSYDNIVKSFSKKILNYYKCNQKKHEKIILNDNLLSVNKIKIIYN